MKRCGVLIALLAIVTSVAVSCDRVVELAPPPDGSTGDDGGNASDGGLGNDGGLGDAPGSGAGSDAGGAVDAS